MPTIVLSSNLRYCRDETARRVARELGCHLIGPEVEATAVATFGASPAKLRCALSPTTSWLRLRRSTGARQLAYFEAALMAALHRRDVLYSGEVGHMFVGGVSHIVKVRLTADLEDRAARRAETDGLPVDKARNLVLKEEVRRRKWFIKVFGVDPEDPSLFDLQINLTDRGIDGACRVIGETAGEIRFQPVTYSVKSLSDNELASRVRADLVPELGLVPVKARDGEITIDAKALSLRKKRKIDSIRSMVSRMDGVSYVLFS